MLTHHTITQLKELHLAGMARAFEEQLSQSAATALAFEERLAMLVERELAYRNTRRVDRLLKTARLKFTTACAEDLDYRPGRGLDKRYIARRVRVLRDKLDQMQQRRTVQRRARVRGRLHVVARDVAGRRARLR